jgi:hypothetical protein
VRPVFPCLDEIYARIRDAVKVADGGRAFTTFQTIYNVQHLTFRQFIGIYTLSASFIFRTVKSVITSSLSPLITLIVRSRAEEQMIRIDAGGIVARMTNFQSIAQRAIVNVKRYSTSPIVLIANADAAISAVVVAAIPNPTRFGLVNFRKKAINFFRMQLRDCKILYSHWGFTSLVKFYLVRLGRDVSAFRRAVSILPHKPYEMGVFV